MSLDDPIVIQRFKVPLATVIYTAGATLPSLSSALMELRMMLRHGQQGDNIVAYYPLEDGSCLQVRLTTDKNGGIEEVIRPIKRIKVSLELEE